MKPSLPSILVPFAIGLAMGAASAESVSSKPIGFNKVTLAGGSDTLCSVPFHLKPAFVGLLSADPTDWSNTTLEADEDARLIVGTAAWTPDEFLGSPYDTHYVRITSGNLAGHHYTVSGNAATSLDIDCNGEDCSGLAAGDSFQLVEIWTLGTLFPNGEAIHPSPSPGSRSSEILLPLVENPDGSLGLNKPFETYFYWNSAWRKVGTGATVQDGAPILPGRPFIVRHNIAGDTVLCADGVVPNELHAIQINLGPAGNDNWLSIDRPVPTSLDDSGLFESGKFAASPAPGARTDELLVFIDDLNQLNKPVKTYYYWNGGWRRVGAGAADVGTEIAFEPGRAVILRKGATEGAEFSDFFVNEAIYVEN